MILKKNNGESAVAEDQTGLCSVDVILVFSEKYER